MKKVFSVMLLAAALIFISGQNNQAEAELSLNNPEKISIVNLTAGRGSDGYEAYVVNISTYLSLRENSSTYSRELARLPNGTKLSVVSRDTKNGFYFVWCYAGAGYVHSNYVSFTGRRVDLP